MLTQSACPKHHIMSRNTTNNIVAPLPLRRLRAKMLIKNLTMRDVATAAEVPYTTACAILRGRLIHPEHLQRLRGVIESAPAPTASPSHPALLQPA